MTRAFIAMSRDGFIAGPGDDLSWLPDGHAGEDHGYEAFIAGVGALLMGRRTYDVVEGFGTGRPYGDTPVLVATIRPLDPIEPTVRAVSGSPGEMLAEARAAAGDRDVYVDGGRLIQQLLGAGLIDAFVVTVIPADLGRASRCWPARSSGRASISRMSARSPPALPSAGTCRRRDAGRRALATLGRMTQPRLIPLGEFFDNPERALAKPSPDGTMISWLAPLDGLLNVWVRPIEGGEPVPVTGDTDRGVMGYSWTRDSRHILYSKDQGGDENHHVMIVDVPGDGTARDLTPFEGVRASMVSVPRATPGQIIVSTNRRERGVFDVERLDLGTGDLTLIATNPGNIIGWVADRDGRVRGAYAQTPEGDYQLLVRDSEQDDFRVLAEFDNEDGGGPFGFDADGGVMWVGSAKDSDRSRLVAIDVATGEQTVIDEDEVADLGMPIVSDKDRTLLGAAYLRDRLVVHAFDDRFARDFEKVRQIADGDPRITGSDADETMWVVAFDSDVDPGATYLFNRETGESEFLFRPRPWLSPDELAPMRPMQITTRDGLTMYCYLTTPRGVEPRDLPTVLYVHGGPWSRDAWGYDDVAQFLANRGYAVLQVNYRGSTGFGKHFMHAAEREFAGKTHDDLMDAVDWAIAEGVADPDRIGIYGGSYGGYATLVGVTFTPDRFRAAVSFVGPSNLVTLIRSFPEYWRPFLKSTWYRFVGDPEIEEERMDMWARSPLSRVDDIVTPLMVIQGANDPRVTKHESDQIVEALTERGVDVEYIVADDEGHGFAKPENRMRAYRAMEGFLAEHLGGRAEQA